eukprot:scaffold13224_cov101-Isochrysis_galbana.AAC.1
MADAVGRSFGSTLSMARITATNASSACAPAGTLHLPDRICTGEASANGCVPKHSVYSRQPSAHTSDGGPMRRPECKSQISGERYMGVGVAAAPVELGRQHAIRLEARVGAGRAPAALAADENILELHVEVGEAALVHKVERCRHLLQRPQLGERPHRRRGGVVPQVATQAERQQHEELCAAVPATLGGLAQAGQDVLVPQCTVRRDLALGQLRGLLVRRHNLLHHQRLARRHVARLEDGGVAALRQEPVQPQLAPAYGHHAADPVARRGIQPEEPQHRGDGHRPILTRGTPLCCRSAPARRRGRSYFKTHHCALSPILRHPRGQDPPGAHAVSEVWGLGCGLTLSCSP